MLSVSQDAKTIKGVKKGVLTGILYLAPEKVSGYNTCRHATPGCAAACLFTAGRAGVFPKINAARIRKTRLFFEDRATFFDLLFKDIHALIRKAKRENLIPAVRLNGTSDIPWERVRVKGKANIFEHFPELQFYDYTKWPSRQVPANYDLTFSRADGNEKHADDAIANGFRVAAVFEAVPDEYMGLPVIPGDDSDIRFKDPVGVYVGLKAKGDAKKDTTGFVIR